MTEDKIIGWHYQLNGHGFEQAPVDGEGQGSLVCRSQWGHKESDRTEHLNSNNNKSRATVAQRTRRRIYTRQLE